MFAFIRGYLDMEECAEGDGGEWGIRTPDRAFAL
jgi:hypothetical protein